MRWLALLSLVAAASAGCSDEREKACFEQLTLGACDELCDAKGSDAACAKATEIRMERCLDDGDRDSCLIVCERTGVSRYCEAAGQTRALTKEAVLGLSIEPGEDFDEARERVTSALGPSIYADRVHQWWAVAEGDACWGLSMEARNGWVGAVFGPAQVTAADGDQLAHCRAAAARNACRRAGGSRSDCVEQHPVPE